MVDATDLDPGNTQQHDIAGETQRAGLATKSSQDKRAGEWCLSECHQF
jgi:hypothetical protein